MLLERLSAQLGLRIERLERFAATASKRYFIYEIDKRDGGKRKIAHPSRSLKLLQRWLNSRVIANLQVHDAASAYKRGTSIRDNAEAHVGSAFTLRVDFKNFFPSFKADGIRKFIQDNQTVFNAWSDQDVQFFIQIVCRSSELTIGAPSSPMLTNAMMYSFDSSLHSYCVKENLVYTRYADDLFISSNEPNKLTSAIANIRKFAQDFPYAQLTINEQKTAFLSRRYRRRITGLIITSDAKISLGRTRKRELKALIHKYRTGQLPRDRHAYLKGLLAFTFDADKPFYNSLCTKYGSKVIAELIGKGQLRFGEAS